MFSLISKDLDLRLNPVTKNEPDYRLFLVHMLPNLRQLGKKRHLFFNWLADIDISLIGHFVYLAEEFYLCDRIAFLEFWNNCSFKPAKYASSDSLLFCTMRVHYQCCKSYNLSISWQWTRVTWSQPSRIEMKMFTTVRWQMNNSSRMAGLEQCTLDLWDSELNV